MSSVTHWIIVAAAFVVAMALLLLGIRRIPAERRRLTLFNMALMFFLMSYGASASIAGEKSSAKAAVAASSTVKTVEGKSSPIKLPPELASAKNWVRFKALWNKLNAVQPKKRGKSKPGTYDNYGIYSRVITREQAMEMEKELAACFGMKDIHHVRQSVSRTYLHMGGSGKKWHGDANVKTLSIPAMALADITLKRIEYMRDGDRTMMTRMLQPVSVMFKGKLLEDLEKRIDALLILRKKGVIRGEEFSTAIRAIRNDIYLNTVLASFNINRLDMFYPVGNSAAARLRDASRLISTTPATKPVLRTRMAMLPIKKIDPITETDKKVAEINRRIKTLKALRKKNTIKDTEYKMSLALLQRERRDLIYFDPDAWIRGFKLSLSKTVPQQQSASKKRSIHPHSTLNAIKKLKQSKPRIDATVTKLHE